MGESCWRCCWEGRLAKAGGGGACDVDLGG